MLQIPSVSSKDLQVGTAVPATQPPQDLMRSEINQPCCWGREDSRPHKIISEAAVRSSGQKCGVHMNDSLMFNLQDQGDSDGSCIQQTCTRYRAGQVIAHVVPGQFQICDTIFDQNTLAIAELNPKKLELDPVPFTHCVTREPSVLVSYSCPTLVTKCS